MPKLFSFLKRNRDKKTRQHEILSNIEGILSSIEGIYEVLAKNGSLHYLDWIEQIKVEVLNLKKMARNLIGDKYVDSRRMQPKCVEVQITEPCFYTRIGDFPYNNHNEQITAEVQNLTGDNYLDMQPRCDEQITEPCYTSIVDFLYNNHNEQITTEVQNLTGDNYLDSSRIQPRCDEQIKKNYYTCIDDFTYTNHYEQITVNYEHIYEKIDPWDSCGSFAAYSKLKTLQKSTDIDSTVSSTDIGTKCQIELDISTYFSRQRPITECQSDGIFSETYSKLPSYSDVLRQDTDIDSISRTSIDTLPSTNSDSSSGYNSDSLSKSRDIEVIGDPLQTSMNQSSDNFNKPYVDYCPYPADNQSVLNQQNSREDTDSCLVDPKTFDYCHKNTDTVSCFNSDTISCASSGYVSDFTSEDYGSPSESKDIKVIDSSDPLQTSLNQLSNDFIKPYVDLHPYPADYRSVSNQQNSREYTDSCHDPKTFDYCHKNTVLQYNNNYFNGAPQCDKFQFVLMPPIHCQSEPNSKIYDDVDVEVDVEVDVGVDVDVETNDNKKLLWSFETSNDQSIAGFMNTIIGEPSNFCGSRHDSFQNVVFDQSQTNCVNWHDISPSTFPDDRAISVVGNENFSMHESEVETHQDSPAQQDQPNSKTNNNNNTIISNTKNSGRLLTPNQKKKNRQKSNSGYYQRKKLTIKQLTDKEDKFTKVNRDLKAKKTELFQSKTFKLLRSLKLYYPRRYNKILPELRKQVDLELECEKQERRWIV